MATDLNHITTAFAYDSVENFTPEELNAHVIVHFRPSSDWLGKGYGFDWMRNGDYKEVLRKAGKDTKYAFGDVDYEELITTQFKEMTSKERQTYAPNITRNGVKYMLEYDSNASQGRYEEDPEAFEELGREYHYHYISGKKYKSRKTGTSEFERYYCPWLSLYKGKTARLSVIIEVLNDEKPYKIIFEENDYYDIEKVEKIDGLKKGRHVIPDAINISCKQEFDSDTKVETFIETQGEEKKGNTFPLGGKMFLWANNKHKQKEISFLFIKVKTNSQNSKCNMKEEELKLADEYLQQAFIKLKDYQLIELNLTDDESFKPNGVLHHSKGVGFYYPKFTETGPETCNLNQYLEEKLLEELKKKGTIMAIKKYIRIYYMDQIIYRQANSEVLQGSSYEKNLRNIVLCPSLNNRSSMTHEIGHFLNLKHTFQNRSLFTNAKYTYIACRTENIMDQVTEEHIGIPYQFWHWQWIIANRSINKDGSFNIEADQS